MLTRLRARLQASLRNAWAFTTSSPLAFAVSVPFAALYFLELWALVYKIRWVELAWFLFQSNKLDNYIDHLIIPTPPYFDIPLIGAPAGWSVESCTWSLLVMTIVAVGSVYLHKKNTLKT